MLDASQLDGLNSREAVEEVAHEIRSHQLNILGLIQLMQKIESGELDTHNLTSPLDLPTGFTSIQQSVNEMSDLVDILIEFMREQDDS